MSGSVYETEFNYDKEDEREEIEEEINSDIHKIDVEDLIERLGTDKTAGLTDEKALSLYNLYGPNRLTPPKKPNKILKIIKELFSGISLLLNIGAILSIASYFINFYYDKEAHRENLYLGISLIIVVLFTTVFGFIQEAKSSKILKSFAKLLPQESLVIRNSRKKNIRSDELVIGDIVLLKGGDMIPADIRLIVANSMKVDNSPLTGESDPQYRTTKISENNFFRAENVAFAYTYVIEGSGKGVIFATGDNTVIGKIAERTASITQGTATLSIEIHKFINIITILAIFIGITSFILSMTIVKSKFIEAAIFFIGIIVANVPEGLIVTVTISLALTAKRMAKKNCLVKNLESIETLGSVSVICSDKTGTITQNKMTVSHLWYDDMLKSVNFSEALTSKSRKQNISKTEELIANAACLCNRAEFWCNQDFSLPVSELLVNGDPTESALLVFYQTFYGSVKKKRSLFKKVFECPFSSNTKIHISIMQNLTTGDFIIIMKGAPERIFQRCQKIVIEDQVLDLNQDIKASFEDAYSTIAKKGERVLGFCYRLLKKEEFEQIFNDLVPGQNIDENSCELHFLGLISMIDPPRPGVPLAIEYSRNAGIRVIMVTGDHPSTALAISKDVGIVTKECLNFRDIKKLMSKNSTIFPKQQAAVITGDDLYQTSLKELDFILLNFHEIVFARTTPGQKLMIVEGFQRIGKIVAVTGDGVNDTPAIRKANIGIAMGLSGSDVTKQAADIVLLDDNFASIVTGIKEGRLIFDNLKKSVAYTLTSNIPEIIPFLLNVIFGIPLPLGTLTILCIDMTTDLIPAISLAYESPETNLMSRKPRNQKKDRMVGWTLIRFTFLIIGVLQTLAAMLSYLYIMLDHGFKWNDLMQRSTWSSKNTLFIKDSYGQEWSYLSRHELEYSCHSAYYLSIVIIQGSDLIISKTRVMSIFKHGVFNNKLLIFGLISQTILSLMFVYVPFFNSFLKTRPIHPKYLLPAIFFNFFLWIADELRRLLIRKNPTCFISRETFY